MPHPMPVIVGVPRSGTTLLRMMLDTHPAVVVPPETGFLPALAEACAADWTARLARTGALGSQVAHYLEIRYERLVTRPDETLEEIAAFSVSTSIR